MSASARPSRWLAGECFTQRVCMALNGAPSLPRQATSSGILLTLPSTSTILASSSMVNPIYFVPHHRQWLTPWGSGASCLTLYMMAFVSTPPAATSSARYGVTHRRCHIPTAAVPRILRPALPFLGAVSETPSYSLRFPDRAPRASRMSNHVQEHHLLEHPPVSIADFVFPMGSILTRLLDSWTRPDTPVAGRNGSTALSYSRPSSAFGSSTGGTSASTSCARCTGRVTSCPRSTSSRSSSATSRSTRSTPSGEFPSRLRYSSRRAVRLWLVSDGRTNCFLKVLQDDLRCAQAVRQRS